MEQHRTTIPLEDLFTIEKLVAAYPGVVTADMLRWQLRHRETNGLATACVRMGKRLMIVKSRYEGWLASRAGAA
jgi:hypothetical protein